MTATPAVSRAAVIAVIVAAVAVVGVQFRTQLAVARAEGPVVVTPADAARVAQASGATAAAKAAGAKRKPIGAQFKGHLSVPKEQRMPAKTGVALSGAWSGTVEALNQNAGLAMSQYTEFVSASAITCAVVLENAGGAWQDRGAHHGDPMTPCPPGVPEDEWTGIYYPWRLTVTAGGVGGDSDSIQLYNWVGDFRAVGGNPHTLPEGVNIFTGDPVATWQMSVSNMYAKGARTELAHAGRQAMDFTDFEVGYSWYGNSDSEATVTATGPDGTVLTATSNMGYGDDEEVDIGAAGWIVTYSMSINDYFTTDTIYAALRSLAFNGIAVSTANLDLWYSATEQDADRAPDQSSAAGRHWSRYEADATAAKIRVADSAGIATWLEGNGPTGGSWSGTSLAPFYGTFRRATGMFDNTTPYDALLVGGPIIEWEEDPPGTWTHTHTKWAGDKAYYQQWKSWEFGWEQQTLSDWSICYIDVDDAWRASAGEDVGGSNATLNDERCAILCHPISASDFTGEPWWGPFTTVSHVATTNVNDPPDVARPSEWVGAGGVTCGPGDSDVWTVAAASASPTVARSLCSRYPLRMARLMNNADPADEHNADWPIMHKANLAIGTTLDDPDWWDSTKGGVDAEDIRDWSGYSYLLVNLTAPKASTVRLTVAYSFYAISDPCTTCFEHRYGCPGDGGFTYTPTDYSLSWDLAVEAGANTILVDFLLPREKVMPVAERSMKHVNSVTWTLPANSSEDPEEWELTGLTLTEDPGEGERAEPSGHWEGRYKRAWDWQTCWFGYAAYIDGKPGLELDYGYLSSFGFTRYEQQLLYIAASVHCPESEATGDLHSLKAVSRLATEVSWQEGWGATDGGALASAGNKDADDAYFAAGLYWFDLQHCDDADGAVNGAVAAGKFGLLAGVEQDWYYSVYPRARLRGVKTDTAATERTRSITDAVAVYKRPAGTSQVFTCDHTCDTYEHGDFESDPVLEKGWEYLVGTTSGLTVANRSYTWARPDEPTYTPIHPDLLEGYISDLHLYWRSSSNIYGQRKPTAAMGWTQPRYVVQGDYPCADNYGAGEIIMAYQTPASQTAFVRTKDLGGSWETVGMSVNGTNPAFVEYNSIQYLVTYHSGIGQVVRRSQTYFSTLLTYTGTTQSALLTANTNDERVSFLKADSDGRVLVAAVPSGNVVHLWRSKTDGETWVQVS